MSIVWPYDARNGQGRALPYILDERTQASSRIYIYTPTYRYGHTTSHCKTRTMMAVVTKHILYTIQSISFSFKLSLLFDSLSLSIVIFGLNRNWIIVLQPYIFERQKMDCIVHKIKFQKLLNALHSIRIIIIIICHTTYIVSRNGSDDTGDLTGILVCLYYINNVSVVVLAQVVHDNYNLKSKQCFKRNYYLYCSFFYIFYSQEELDEVFNQLSQKPEQPGKLTTNWPPNRNDANYDTYPENRDYTVDNFGGQFDDVILELQLPERIVCQTCAEGIGQ